MAEILPDYYVPRIMHEYKLDDFMTKYQQSTYIYVHMWKSYP